MSWALWLAAPLVATLLAAVWTWWRARPDKPLDTDGSMRAHGEYLDALAETARSRDRGLRSGDPRS